MQLRPLPHLTVRRIQDVGAVMATPTHGLAERSSTVTQVTFVSLLPAALRPLLRVLIQ